MGALTIYIGRPLSEPLKQIEELYQRWSVKVVAICAEQELYEQYSVELVVVVIRSIQLIQWPSLDQSMCDPLHHPLHPRHAKVLHIPFHCGICCWLCVYCRFAGTPRRPVLPSPLRLLNIYCLPRFARDSEPHRAIIVNRAKLNTPSALRTRVHIITIISICWFNHFDPVTSNFPATHVPRLQYI